MLNTDSNKIETPLLLKKRRGVGFWVPRLIIAAIMYGFLAYGAYHQYQHNLKKHVLTNLGDFYPLLIMGGMLLIIIPLSDIVYFTTFSFYEDHVVIQPVLRKVRKVGYSDIKRMDAWFNVGRASETNLKFQLQYPDGVSKTYTVSSKFIPTEMNDAFTLLTNKGIEVYIH